MIHQGYEAIGHLMQQDPTIASIVASYAGTTYPLIKYGVLPEDQRGLPAITYARSSYSDRYGAVSTQLYTINCYARDHRDSTLLADAVYNLFRDAVGDAGSYPLHTSSTMLGSITEQDGGAVNTPVQVRVISPRS